MGYIYLLHFDQPICPTRPSRHYLGWTDDLDRRIRQHRKGQGSRFCQVARERGINFEVVEVLRGDRALERQLKNQKNHPKMCPICNRGKQQNPAFDRNLSVQYLMKE